jgi:hypothetical protein
VCGKHGRGGNRSNEDRPSADYGPLEVAIGTTKEGVGRGPETGVRTEDGIDQRNSPWGSEEPEGPFMGVVKLPIGSRLTG